MIVLADADSRKPSYAGGDVMAATDGWPQDLKDYFWTGRFVTWGGQPMEWSLRVQYAHLGTILDCCMLWESEGRAPVPSGRATWDHALGALRRRDADDDADRAGGEPATRAEPEPEPEPETEPAESVLNLEPPAEPDPAVTLELAAEIARGAEAGAEADSRPELLVLDDDPVEFLRVRRTRSKAGLTPLSDDAAATSDLMPKSEVKRKMKRKAPTPRQARKATAPSAAPRPSPQAVSTAAKQSIQEMLLSMDSEMRLLSQQHEAT